MAELRAALHEAMAAVNELAIVAATEKAAAAELKELRRPWWVRWFPKSGDPQASWQRPTASRVQPDEDGRRAEG